MIFVFEISRPIQWKPNIYRSELTLIRVYWLFFAISVHRMRFDELMEMANSGIAVWTKKP